MATKKPTITSLKRDLAAAEEREAKLQKELESAKSLKDHYSKASTEKQQEIDAVHDLLDVLPNAIKRRNEDKYVDNNIMTRLASYLALRG